MDRMIVSRHGESEAIAAGIENGDPSADRGLTEHGRDQARTLGRDIAPDPIDLCVVSRFPRVQQTASLALEGRAVAHLVDPNLNDICYGIFEGRPKAAYTSWVKAHDLATPIPDGESRLQVAARLCAALEALLARPERCALVVTHELLIDDLLAAIDGRPPAPTHGDIPLATPFRLAATDVSRGVEFLRAFLTTARAEVTDPASL